MAEVLDHTKSEYPALLKTIPDYPSNLYYEGNIAPGIFDNCLAVVGSRKMTPYGKKVINHLFSTLSKSITVVSGFTYGVDTEAHEMALSYGLKTVAVLPCGIDLTYPASHSRLREKLLVNNGVILSEYPGKIGPRIWMYSKRNRIVAGISKATLVIEAAESSGSLVTAGFANLFNRQVFAVPGDVFSSQSKGCLQILRTFAKPVDSGCAINEILNLHQIDLFPKANAKDESDAMLNILKTGSYTIDELAFYLSIPICQASSNITVLCLNGLVVEEGGKFYAC